MVYRRRIEPRLFLSLITLISQILWEYIAILTETLDTITLSAILLSKLKTSLWTIICHDEISVHSPLSPWTVLKESMFKNLNCKQQNLSWWLSNSCREFKKHVNWLESFVNSSYRKVNFRKGMLPALLRSKVLASILVALISGILWW